MRGDPYSTYCLKPPTSPTVGAARPPIPIPLIPPHPPPHPLAIPPPLQLLQLARLEGHADAVFALHVAEGGTGGAVPLLASASKDTTIRLWEIGRGWDCLGVLVAHTDSVVALVRLRSHAQFSGGPLAGASSLSHVALSPFAMKLF